MHVGCVSAVIHAKSMLTRAYKCAIDDPVLGATKLHPTAGINYHRYATDLVSVRHLILGGCR
jgi:hypothetical protein